MRKRLRTIGIQVLISLVLLEVVLQLLYVGILLFFPRHEPEEIGEGERVVMCIGDSFTFGLGTSSLTKSYPAQLQEILRERAGSEWRVVNNGWPGRCTHGFLERIDEQLAAARPEILYVVAGLNDRYSDLSELVLPPPSEDQPAQAHGDAWHWEWRSAKLFRMLGSLIYAPNPAADLTESIAGTWVSKDGAVCRFRRDGSATIMREDLTWQVEDDRLVLSREDALFSTATVTLDGDRLAIRTDDGGELVLFRVQDVEPSKLVQRIANEDPGSESEPTPVVLSDVDRIVEGHLDQLIQRCKAAGVDLVLASYPHQSPHNSVIRRLVARHGIGYVDVREGFIRALAEQPDRDLFVPDQHCNDEGYRLMAEIVARDALDRIQRR